jgi:hypothetical protein
MIKIKSKNDVIFAAAPKIKKLKQKLLTLNFVLHSPMPLNSSNYVDNIFNLIMEN